MIHILKENKLAYLAINYVDTKRISQEDLDKIITVDSSPTKSFSEWIVQQFIVNPSIESKFNDLAIAIKVYSKHKDIFKDLNYKDKSVEEFIDEVKTKFRTNINPKESVTIDDVLSKFKVGTVLAHTLYVIPKGSVDVSTIFHSIPNIPEDIVQYGDVIYVLNNNNKYIISFSADIYLDGNGNSIPLKQQNVALWDNIFTWLYNHNHVQEDIIACIDLFGENFDGSKLSKAIETSNPKEVFSKYYSNSANKLMNIIVNTNSRSVSDYSKHIDKFKNLGFGLKGILLDIDLGSVDLAELKSTISEETYESEVKAHFKRTGQSFDSTTFQKIKSGFDQNATLYFIVIRDNDPTGGIFIESGNNVIGFVNKSELSHLLNKFHSARKIVSIKTQIVGEEAEQKLADYDRQLENIKSDIEGIIKNSKSLKHYIVL